MRNIPSAVCGLWLCTSLLGCASSERVNIGDTAVLGARLSDYAGQWSGYAEAYTWNDGTDSVRVALDGNGQGVLEVGDAIQLPAPDPNQNFPGGEGDDVKRTPLPVVSGFSFPIYDATVETQRIRLRARGSDVYQEWCELQTPQAITGEQGTYNCIGTRAFIQGDTASDGSLFCSYGQARTPIDCGKLACAYLCDCSQTTCQAADQTKNLRLDGALAHDGNELVGTLVVDSDRITVRLTRQ